MFNKFKTLVSEFVDSCNKSKEKAISNIALLVLGIAIAGLALFAIIYISRYVLLAAVLILVFCPGIYAWLDSRLNGNVPTSVSVPAYIGCDGYHVQPDEVETAFQSLRKYFTTVYYQRFYDAPNHVLYCFECGFRQDMPESYELIQIIQKECERVLAKQCMSYGLDLPYSSLVATDFRNPRLLIYFAKNEDGAKELFAQKERIRRKYRKTSDPRNNIYEDWEGKYGSKK